MHGLDLYMQSYELVGASYSPILRIRNVKLEELKSHDGVIQLR